MIVAERRRRVELSQANRTSEILPHRQHDSNTASVERRYGTFLDGSCQNMSEQLVEEEGVRLTSSGQDQARFAGDNSLSLR